jgi:hypothetical protein
MTATDAVAFDVEQGLIELPGTPPRWIWAFTCPTPKCACRAAIVVSAAGERGTLLERGRPVADAWLARAHYGQAAQDLQDVVAFAVDLDTLTLFPPAGAAPLDPAVEPEVREVVDRLHDDVLDAIARVWRRGKGESPPPEPGADGAKIEVEGWRPGDLVVWDDARPSLRGDTYVFGERIFEAVELYCVEPDCDCGEVIVDFGAVVPRGAPHPGHVEFNGEAATLRPEHERQRERLTELWTAYCARHPRHQARFARRSATMHGLAGRIVAAPAKPKVARNELCPCGSGKKSKKCCGVT